MALDRQAARRRHPANGWQPDLDRLTARLAQRLRADGHRWAGFAAAVITERGRLGLDRDSFARLLVIDPDVLAGIEEGTLAPDAAPDTLRRLVARPDPG